MPSAVELANTVLKPPQSGPPCHTQPSSLDTPASVLPETLYPVSQDQLTQFRDYLATIPFKFPDSQQCIAGRVMNTEGDVRLFLESATVLSCWLIVLSMVPPTNRHFDLRLHSEKSPEDRNRPDILIASCKRVGTQPQLKCTPISAIVFKAPGVLALCQNPDPIQDNDDWEIVTSQARKYAIHNDVQHIILMDDKYGLYMNFSDAENLEAAVDYLISPVSNAPTSYPGAAATLRVLVLYSAYARISASPSLRDFANGPAVLGACDYVDILPADSFPPTSARNHATAQTCRSALQSRNAATQARSMSSNVPCSLVFRPKSLDYFPSCKIRPIDLSPPSGVESNFLSSRREVNSLCSDGFVESLHLDVAEFKGILVSVLPDDGEGPPSSTKEIAVKLYDPDEGFIRAYREAAAYKSLTKLQGYEIPYCYGLFDVVDYQNIAMFLEEIEGDTLDDILTQINDQNGQKDLFQDCWSALERIHRAGFSHGDVRGPNIMILADGKVVFVDLENSRPLTRMAQKLDWAHLRMSFRLYGLSEKLLKSWTP